MLITAMVKKQVIRTAVRLVKNSGVICRFKSLITGRNSRGVPISYPGEEVTETKVVYLEKRYDPLSPAEPEICKSLEGAKYLLCLPDVKLYRDALVYDKSGKICARLDLPEVYDGGGDEPLFVQYPLDFPEHFDPLVVTGKVVEAKAPAEEELDDETGEDETPGTE